MTKTIDVTNQGNMPGGAFIAIISGGAVGSFHLLDENCTGIPLSPNATCNLQVSFDPISTSAKPRSAPPGGEHCGRVAARNLPGGQNLRTSPSGG